MASPGTGKARQAATNCVTPRLAGTTKRAPKTSSLTPAARVMGVPSRKRGTESLWAVVGRYEGPPAAVQVTAARSVTGPLGQVLPPLAASSHVARIAVLTVVGGQPSAD